LFNRKKNAKSRFYLPEDRYSTLVYQSVFLSKEKANELRFSLEILTKISNKEIKIYKSKRKISWLTLLIWREPVLELDSKILKV
jgi:hypothetical protein